MLCSYCKYFMLNLAKAHGTCAVVSFLLMHKALGARLER